MSAPIHTPGNERALMRRMADTVRSFVVQQTFRHTALIAPENVYISGNAMFDGINWNRLDTAKGARQLIVVNNDTVLWRTAPAGANPIAWTTSTLAANLDSGWQNVGNYAANWQAYTDANFTPQYRKLPNGLVILKGLVMKTVAYAAGDIMFSLPAGFRPGDDIRIFSTRSAAGASETRVYSDGTVQSQTGGSQNWNALDGIAFMSN